MIFDNKWQMLSSLTDEYLKMLGPIPLTSHIQISANNVRIRPYANDQCRIHVSLTIVVHNTPLIQIHTWFTQSTSHLHSYVQLAQYIRMIAVNDLPWTICGPAYFLPLYPNAHYDAKHLLESTLPLLQWLQLQCRTDELAFHLVRSIVQSFQDKFIYGQIVPNFFIDYVDSLTQFMNMDHLVFQEQNGILFVAGNMTAFIQKTRDQWIYTLTEETAHGRYRLLQVLSRS